MTKQQKIRVLELVEKFDLEIEKTQDRVAENPSFYLHTNCTDELSREEVEWLLVNGFLIEYSDEYKNKNTRYLTTISEYGKEALHRLSSNIIIVESLTPDQNQSDHDILNSPEGVSIILNNGIRNKIHPTAIIGKNVILGKNNEIGAYCVIEGDTVIGDNNKFTSFCSIGTEPEHKSFFGKPNKGTVIGDNNTFREFTTVNAGCERATELKDNIIMLRGSHVGHDSLISNGCIISCNVLIGGHSILGTAVNMGLGSICHQYSQIGSFSMIGMGCIITKKTEVECFGVYVGNPAKYIRENDFHKIDKTDEEVFDTISKFNKIITQY